MPVAFNRSPTVSRIELNPGDVRIFPGASPGLVDSQASDADAIGIYPVHTQ